jgi:hypothetical protein
MYTKSVTQYIPLVFFILIWQPASYARIAFSTKFPLKEIYKGQMESCLTNGVNVSMYMVIIWKYYIGTDYNPEYVTY